MNIDDVKEEGKNFIKKFPEHAAEVLDLIQLCKDNIEEGESVENECMLCIESIKQLNETT